MLFIVTLLLSCYPEIKRGLSRDEVHPIKLKMAGLNVARCSPPDKSEGPRFLDFAPK